MSGVVPAEVIDGSKGNKEESTTLDLYLKQCIYMYLFQSKEERISSVSKAKVKKNTTSAIKICECVVSKSQKEEKLIAGIAKQFVDCQVRISLLKGLMIDRSEVLVVLVV